MTQKGHYKLGFEFTPLTEDGNLDMSGDFNRGPHPIDQDPLFKMAEESRDQGNKLVKEGDHEGAIACYSDLIMKLRAVEQETDIEWNDAGHEAVNHLRAAAYLNLSLCFLKTQQWTHASNTATRVKYMMIGPPTPPRVETSGLTTALAPPSRSIPYGRNDSVISTAAMPKKKHISTSLTMK